MPVQQLGLGLLWYIAFVISTTLHEAAHGFIALRLGDPTARDVGLVTLDPVPHIRRSPIGMVLVPLVSFFLGGGWMLGWASTPYDPFWARANRSSAVWMSLAGPAANLLLLLLAALLIRLGMHFGVFAAPEQVTWERITAAQSSGPLAGTAVALSILFSLNLILLIFNLLPLPPLDGSEILVLFLHDSAAERYREFLAQPAAAMIGLIVAWSVLDAILGPVQLFALTLLYPGVRYS